MALILFASSMFGIMSALRTINHFRTRAVISSQHLTKIGTGSCALVIGALFLFARDPICGIFAVSGVIFAQFFSLWIIEHIATENLKREVPGFLDRWILNMKLGSALSAARTAALQELNARARALIEPLFVNSDSRAKSHLILDEKLLPELLELSHSPHSALARLENARAWMRKSDAFRRKSGQATRQTMIQAIVLLILLFALAVFTVQRHGWRRNSDLIFGSFVLSGLGIFTMHHLSRKKRWKI